MDVYSSNRKRKLKRSNFIKKDSFKRKRNEDNKFEIIDKVRSQTGVRGQLVIFQSSLDLPYVILQNAVDRINGALFIRNLEKKDGKYKFQLAINDECFAQEWYYSDSLALARKALAEVTLSVLQKTCFTIIRKIHPRDSPQIDFISPSSSSTNTTGNVPPPVTSANVGAVGGIGAKMMLQMGWSGGGLGAQEQGCTDLVEPYIQIKRQGLGTKNIVGEVRKVLQDYASSKDINSIAFSPDFTKEERNVIHQVARKLNLKSKSYGKGSDRILVVQSKVSPWDLVYLLLEAGGENEQFKLIIPTDIKK